MLCTSVTENLQLMARHDVLSSSVSVLKMEGGGRKDGKQEGEEESNQMPPWDDPNLSRDLSLNLMIYC